MRPSSPVPEASWLLRQIARQATDDFITVKEAINLAHRALSKRLPGLKVSRIEDIWRGEARVIRAEELDAIRTEADLERKARHADAVVKQDIERLEARLLEIENTIGSRHQPSFARLGTPDRSVAGGLTR